MSDELTADGDGEEPRNTRNTRKADDTAGTATEGGVEGNPGRDDERMGRLWGGPATEGARVTRHGIEIPSDRIAEFCRRNGIRRLAFFGSFIRDDFSPGSDIDVLVEFGPQVGIGFFELFAMERELSTLLGGRKVEMNTPHSLGRYFRDEVLAEAEVAYAAA